MTVLAPPAVAHRSAGPVPSLPPVGPTWYPTVMGTAILATLTQVHAGSSTLGRALAAGWLVVAWSLLLLLTALFAIRVGRDRRALTTTLHEPQHVAMWGTVAMGLLAVGSATITVVPAVVPSRTGAAGWVDAALWTLGTGLGLVTAFGFAALLVHREAGTPTAVWGLPIVPPMVSATTGSALVPLIGSPAGRVWMSIATVACFFAALSLGAVVFGVVYHSHWRHQPVPLTASASTWIPLGIVGQSTAAAQAMAAQARGDLTPALREAVGQAANAYGWVMLAVGVPLIGYAVAVTLRGFAGRMPFGPGWWALTFPVGTLSLGAHLLGVGTGSSFVGALGTAAWLALVGTWTLCAVATVRVVSAHLTGRGGSGSAAASRR